MGVILVVLGLGGGGLHTVQLHVLYFSQILRENTPISYNTVITFFKSYKIFAFNVQPLNAGTWSLLSVKQSGIELQKYTNYGSIRDIKLFFLTTAKKNRCKFFLCMLHIQLFQMLK